MPDDYADQLTEVGRGRARRLGKLGREGPGGPGGSIAANGMKRPRLLTRRKAAMNACNKITRQVYAEHPISDFDRFLYWFFDMDMATWKQAIVALEKPK